MTALLIAASLTGAYLVGRGRDPLLGNLFFASANIGWIARYSQMQDYASCLLFTVFLFFAVDGVWCWWRG